MCPSVWLAAPSLCLRAGARRTGSPSALRDLPNSATVPNSAPVQTEMCLLHKDPRRGVSTPCGLWPLPRTRGGLYLERELDSKNAAKSLRQGPLLGRPGRGANHCRPCSTILQVGVEPEAGQRLRQACPAAARPMAPLGVAIEGLGGPVSCPVWRDPAAARRRPGPSWAEATPGPRGSESWCCRCSSMGVRLDRDAA